MARPQSRVQEPPGSEPPGSDGEAAAVAAMMDIAGVEASPADAGEDSDDNTSVASDAGAPEEMVEPEEDAGPAIAAVEQQYGVWQRDDHADISRVRKTALTRVQGGPRWIQWRCGGRKPVDSRKALPIGRLHEGDGGEDADQITRMDAVIGVS